MDVVFIRQVNIHHTGIIQHSGKIHHTGIIRHSGKIHHTGSLNIHQICKTIMKHVYFQTITPSYSFNFT